MTLHSDVHMPPTNIILLYNSIPIMMCVCVCCASDDTSNSKRRRIESEGIRCTHVYTHIHNVCWSVKYATNKYFMAVLKYQFINTTH